MTYLHLNVVGLKHLGLLDESHNEDGVAIGNISDIYQHEDTLDRVMLFARRALLPMRAESSSVKAERSQNVRSEAARSKGEVSR